MKRSAALILIMSMVFALISTPVAFGAEKQYKLDKVVVLSRHNIRAPLSGSGSLLGDITPHEWVLWTSNPSELSLRGGILETIMGQYFRLWLEDEGLFPENYRPENEEVRFYANSKQRTLSTAHYFSAGLLPVANVLIESHSEYDTMDPTFYPVLTFYSDRYAEDAIRQISEMGGDAGLEGIQEKLNDAIEMVMGITDMNSSDAYLSGKYGDLFEDANEIVLKQYEEPALIGPIKTATSIADALTLQYYEEPDAIKAAFGHELTEDDWRFMHNIVDVYTEMLFTAPLIADNIANPLLKEIRSELAAQDRKFSFLCGHDSNIASVLSALGVEEYDLPGTIEPKTPIGGKVVFERFLDTDGQAYYQVSFVYQSTEQIRNIEPLTLKDPPMKTTLRFKGVQANENGMITEEDMFSIFDDAISRFDMIQEEYSEELEPAA